jgi:hypothetical protein
MNITKVMFGQKTKKKKKYFLASLAAVSLASFYLRSYYSLRKYYMGFLFLFYLEKNLMNLFY